MDTSTPGINLRPTPHRSPVPNSLASGKEAQPLPPEIAVLV